MLQILLFLVFLKFALRGLFIDFSDKNVELWSLKFDLKVLTNNDYHRF
jgi:hypothetical protein